MIFKYNTKVFLYIQLIVILTILYFFNNNYQYLNQKPGNNIVTKNSKSNWNIIKYKKHKNNTLSKIFKLEYSYIYNYLEDDYPMFKGHIALLDGNNELFGVFNKFLVHLYYYNFIYYFKKYVDMNNEIYKVDIKDSLLYLKFVNKCNNNSVLYEEYQNGKHCGIKDIYIKKIDEFIVDFFDEELETHSHYNYYFSNI